MNKKTSQKIHAKRRALERYNLKLTDGLYNLFLEKVASNKAETLYWQSNRVSIKTIKHEDKDYYFVYDKERRAIVTFLTADQIDWQRAKDYKKSIQYNHKEMEILKKSSWEELKNSIKRI